MNVGEKKCRLLPVSAVQPAKSATGGLNPPTARTEKNKSLMQRFLMLLLLLKVLLAICGSSLADILLCLGEQAGRRSEEL